MAPIMSSLKQSVDQKPERQYPVPANCVSIFPEKLNPLYGAEPMAGEADRWSLETSLFPERRFELIRCIAKQCAFMYPLCTDPDRWCTMVKLYLNFTIVDDHLDNADGQMGRRLPEVDTILDQLYGVCDKLTAAVDGTGQHVSAHHWKPYVLGAYALYDTVCAAYNEVQKRRFIQLTRDWTDGMVAESYHLGKKRRFNTIDEFYEIREKSGAVLMCMQLIEYADNLYVPDNEWRNPDLQRLLTQMMRLVVICNDLYSLDKELLDAGSPDGVFNCVIVSAQMDNISLTESMNRWVIKYIEMERETLALANELTTRAQWVSPDTRTYINHALHFVGGHWKQSTIIDRFNALIKVEKVE